MGEYDDRERARRGAGSDASNQVESRTPGKVTRVQAAYGAPRRPNPDLAPGKRTLTQGVPAPRSVAPAPSPVPDALRLKPESSVAPVSHAGAALAPAAAGPVAMSSYATSVYLMINSRPAWDAISAHLRQVSWPAPTGRLTLSEPDFVKQVIAALQRELGDFNPARIDPAMSPHDVFAEIEPMRPSDALVWAPAVGARLGQLFHAVIAESLQRMAPRFVTAMDARSREAAHRIVMITQDELVSSHPMDRYVAVGLTARLGGKDRQVATVVPDASRGAKKQELRQVVLTWEGALDPKRWNWVRAQPADATAEEVAASLDRARRMPPGGPTSMFASELAAAPPLFGLPEVRARQFRQALAYAPMPLPANAQVEDKPDTIEARLASIATTHAADDIALHQAASAKEAPSSITSSDELRATFGDVLVQLGAIRASLGPWGFAGEIVGAITYISMRRETLLKAGHAQLLAWAPVATGQRDRLFRIVASIRELTAAAGAIGKPRDPNHPLRTILATFAAAAASSHLASTCEALVARAEASQAALNLRSLQANLVDLEMAMDQAHPGGRTPDKATAETGSAYEAIRRDAMVLENRLVNGGEVDPHELERVQIDAQEAALKFRVHGLQVQVGVLQLQAGMASHGFSARIAGLFSGKFRDLPGVAGFLVAALAGVQLDLQADYLAEATKPRADDGDGLDPLPPKVAAKKRAVGRAQAKFAKLSEDADLRHFLSEGAQLVEAQQLRTACVQAAVMIGISIATSAAGGFLARTLGQRFLSAQAVETVAELTSGAQRFIRGATFATEVAGNALGQYATTDDGLLKSLADNALIMLGTNAILGRVSHDVQAGRNFRRMLDQEVRAIESLEAKAAMQGSKVARIARWTAHQTLEITGHAVTGMAMGAITQKLEEELAKAATHAPGGDGAAEGQARVHASSGGQLQELLIQSASVALGKLTHARLGERMPSLARLAQERESARAQRLYADAQQLQRLSQEVSTSGNGAAALELLDRQRQLLQDEIATLDEIAAKLGATQAELGDLSAGRRELESQLRNVTDAGMLTLRLHLVGLRELGGSLWSGTHEDVQRAKQQLQITDRSAKITEDPATGTIKATVAGQAIEIHEVAGPARHGAGPAAQAGGHGAKEGHQPDTAEALRADIAATRARGSIEVADERKLMERARKLHVSLDEVPRATKVASSEEVQRAGEWARSQAESGAGSDPNGQDLREAQKEVRELNQGQYRRVQDGTLDHPNATKERLKDAVEGERDGQRVPLTFKSREQFEQFRAELRDVFESEGVSDATVVQIGSGTTGWKGNPQKYRDYLASGGTKEGWARHAAWKPSSDTDFAVFSRQALVQAQHVNAPVNAKFGVFKNGEPADAGNAGRPGFSNSSLGKKLFDLATRWNVEVYGEPQPEAGGFDFKLNLDPTPFSTPPTIYEGPEATRAKVLSSRPEGSAKPVTTSAAKEPAQDHSKAQTETSQSTEPSSLRQAYVDEVSSLGQQVSEMRRAGMTDEAIARDLHARRRALGVKYKNLTPPEMLERIYDRNLAKYGDRLGPTVEWLRAAGKSWQQIIESATRTGGKDLGL